MYVLMTTQEVIMADATTAARPPTRVKRTFGRLVDDPNPEDYSLRYAPGTFRR
jgi:hypothetical protein